MSAFMMSNKTLSMLSDLISRYHMTGGDAFGLYFPRELMEELYNKSKYRPLTSEVVFDSLAELNVESLKQRYPHGYKSMLGEIKYVPGCDIWKREVMNMADGVAIIEPWHYQVLKSLDCYLYQCCEGNCDELPLYKALETFRDKWGLYIAKNQPEYELAEWD